VARERQAEAKRVKLEAARQLREQMFKKDLTDLHDAPVGVRISTSKAGLRASIIQLWLTQGQVHDVCHIISLIQPLVSWVS
jgi:hypothetical protein